MRRHLSVLKSRARGLRLWVASVVLLSSVAAAQVAVPPTPGGVEGGDDGAAAVDDGQSYPTTGVTEAERAELMQQARKPIPAGLQQGQLKAEYWRRHEMAIRAHAPPLTAEIARAWHAALPDDFHGTWHLANASLTYGDIQGFIRLGELAIRQASMPGIKALVASEIGARQLDLLGDVAAAQETLAQAERFVAQSRRATAGSEGFYAARGESRTLGFKGNLLLEQGRLAPAAEAAAESVAAAERASQLARAIGTDAASQADRDLLRAGLRHSTVLRRIARTYDAEQALRRVLLQTRTAGASLQANTFIFEEAAALRIQQGRFVEAEQWTDRAMNAFPPERIRLDAVPASAHVRMLVQKQNALAGQQRFADVLAVMRDTDQRVDLAPDLKPLAANQLVRAWSMLRTGRPTQALPIAQALQNRLAAALGGEHVSVVTAQAVYAWALLDSGQRDAAIAHFDDLIPRLLDPVGVGAEVDDQALLRQLRRDVAAAFLRAVSAQPDARRVSLALRVADWVQSSSVQQALADAAVRHGVNTPQLQDVLRREQDIGHELQALYRYLNRQDSSAAARQTPDIARQMRARLDALEIKHRQVREQLARTFPDFERLVRPRPPGAEEIAAALRPGDAFVHLLPTAQETYAFVVVNGAAARLHRAKVGEPKLAEWVRRARATLDVADQGRRAPAFDRTAATALYDALLRPLQAQLAGKTHVIVAAHGVLAQIPFAVLDTAGADAAEARWLIQDAAISHVPGATAWLALQRQLVDREGAARFFGWGDPLFDARVRAAPGTVRHLEVARAAAGAGLDLGGTPGSVLYGQIPPLPETREEVVAIARTLGADAQRDALFGASATRASVLDANRSGDLARRRVLLFATHGLVPGDLPKLTQPALAMAADGSEKDDPLAPLLTLEDVLGLKLDADWVVLSACNTAAADGSSEESLSGLARGFFYAGSRSLLVTHWAVESESAMRITSGTFSHYVANPAAPKAESLRQAMLQVMAMPKFAHPAFWAPYALVGEGGR